MDFDYKKLTSEDFENLAYDVLKYYLGVNHIERFKSGQDQGIDLRYSRFGNQTVIQCKHYIKSGFNTLFSHLQNSELAKVKRLNPSRYVLMTSVEMSPAQKQKIHDLFAPYIINTADILSLNDVDGIVAGHQDIVDKNYKLWFTSTYVLQRILNNAACVKTQELINRIQEKIELYVQTKSYRQALKKIADNKVLIISGNAGIGKTMLANMLVYHFMSKDYEPIEVTNNISEAWVAYNKDAKQIFYYDDFLGKTFHNCLDKNEDASILDFIHDIETTHNKLFILTTREHILINRCNDCEILNNNEFLSNKYLLKLDDYSTDDKARILYNHLYFSKISQEYIDNILQNRNYMKIIRHHNYSPRIVEWMTNVCNINQAVAHNDYCAVFLANLDNPARIWQYAYEHQISLSARDLLIALYISGHLGNDIDKIENVFNKYHQLHCRKTNNSYEKKDYKIAIRELENSFIRINVVPQSAKREIQYYDPSVKDFMEYYILSSDFDISTVVDTIETPEQVIAMGGLFIKNRSNLDILENKIVEISEKEINKTDRNVNRSLLPQYLQAVIKINDSLLSRIIFDEIKKLFQILDKTLFYDCDDYLNLLNCIQTSNIPADDKATYILQLKNYLLNMIKKERCSDIFLDILETNKMADDVFSFDELVAVRDEFRAYLKDDIVYECKDRCQSVFAVDDFNEQIQKIADFFAIDTEDFSFEQEISDYRSQLYDEDSDNDVFDYWNYESPTRSIDDMFATLKGKS